MAEREAEVAAAKESLAECKEQRDLLNAALLDTCIQLNTTESELVECRATVSNMESDLVEYQTAMAQRADELYGVREVSASLTIDLLLTNLP